jgi:hypothetical protein
MAKNLRRSFFALAQALAQQVNKGDGFRVASGLP